MKQLKSCAGVALILWCVVASVVSVRSIEAQEFFPKNYVQGESQQQSATSSQSAESNSQQATGPQPLAAVMPIKQKIQAIVYVSSSNKEHFDQVVSKVLALQRQRKIHIHALMHIGDYRNVAAKQTEELTNAGILISALPKLPDKLPASQSPAWGIMTPESGAQRSAYLIEGYMEPELFFNQASKFEIPAGMQVGQDVEREGKLSEF
ncbi:MAG: hypothetical protein ACK5HO_14370 [Pseudomonadota bacterium]|jgi:hypothetical protein